MIIFNASMPRAGSSLLQHIMGQNPDFYVTPTSPLFHIIEHTVEGFHKAPVHIHPSIYDDIENSLYSFCRKGIEGYTSNISSKNHFIDKNRGWLQYYPFLQRLYPKPKIICLVRDLRSVLASLEKQFRKRPPKHWEIGRTHRTVSERYEFYLTIPLFNIYIRDLENIIETKNYKDILFIRFEDMCLNPQKTFNKIYNYLNLPLYNHNFNNIKQLYDEVDSSLLLVEHNNINQELKLPPVDYNQILGKNISNEIYEKYIGFYKFFNYTR